MNAPDGLRLHDNVDAIRRNALYARLTERTDIHARGPYAFLHEIVPDGKSTEQGTAARLTGRTAIAVRKAHQLDANILIRFHAIRELVQGW